MSLRLYHKYYKKIQQRHLKQPLNVKYISTTWAIWSQASIDHSRPMFPFLYFAPLQITWYMTNHECSLTQAHTHPHNLTQIVSKCIYLHLLSLFPKYNQLVNNGTLNLGRETWHIANNMQNIPPWYKWKLTTPTAPFWRQLKSKTTFVSDLTSYSTWRTIVLHLLICNPNTLWHPTLLFAMLNRKS